MLLATAALLVDDIVGSLFRRAAHDRGNSGDGLPGWEPAVSRLALIHLSEHPDLRKGTHVVTTLKSKNKSLDRKRMKRRK
ncbi:hypothetical protein PV413_35425, partial [Streptomyces scabiei]|uniref:hypothetical protein n=1 Tax=Streptomyces scabiei TaxID=1930 RepID=UPI0029A94AB4